MAREESSSTEVQTEPALLATLGAGGVPACGRYKRDRGLGGGCAAGGGGGVTGGVIVDPSVN